MSNVTTFVRRGKYGALFACVILQATPTRYLVRFTAGSGELVERWVPRSAVIERDATA